MSAESTTSGRAKTKPPIIASKLRLFLIFSLGLHFGLAVVYGIPEYFRRIEAERLAREAEDKAERLDEYEKKRKKEEKKQRKEETEKDVAAELKNDFERIIQDDLTEMEMDGLWDDILTELDDDLSAYADELIDPDTSDIELGEMMDAMKSAMVHKLNDQLKELNARKLAKDFLNTVKNQIAPRLSDFYKKEIERRVGSPLKNEGKRIVKKENSIADRARDAMKKALDKAQNETKKAETQLAAAKNRVAKAREESKQRNKTTHDKAGEAAKAETKNIEQAKEKLAAASAKAQQASEHSPADDAKAKAEAGAEQGKQAHAKANDAQAAAQKGDADETKKNLNASQDDAKKMGAELAQAQKKLEHSNADAKAKTQKALGEAQDLAAAAMKAMEASKSKIEEAEGAAASQDKKLAQATQKENQKLASAESALKQAKNALETAAKNSEHFGKDLEEQIKSTSDEQADAAAKKTAEARKKAKAGEAAETENGTEEARKATQDLAQSISKAKKAAEEAAFDAKKFAESILKDITDKEIKQSMEQAFQENFKKGSLPRMTESLTKSFENQLRHQGTQDQALVQEVNKQLEKMLGQDVPEQTKAGEASTEQLSKDMPHAHLDGAGQAPASMQKSVEAAARKGAEQMQQQMANITNNRKAESHFTQMAQQAMQNQAMQNQGLAERVATMAHNVSQGRMSMLQSNATRKIARLRQSALTRTQGKSNLFTRYKYDKTAHKELISGMADRDAKAAKGDAIVREGASGEASSGEEDKDVVQAATMLMPPEPKVESEGKVENEEPFEPKFKTINFAAMPYVQENITLDGDLEDWKDIPALTVSPSWHGRRNSKYKVSQDQVVKIAWDNGGFYFAYNITDADADVRRVRVRNFWEGDGVEIFLDAQNTKDRKRGSEYVQQFWFWVDGEGGRKEHLGGEASVIKKNGRKTTRYIPYTAANMQRASKMKGDSWRMECYLPFKLVKNLDVQPGKILGFNFSVCTGTNLYYYWGGADKVRTSDNPDTWGDVLLAGSDGKLKLPEKLEGERGKQEGDKQIRAVVIGKALKLRVIDPDMNLDSREKDKISVTVKTRHGDSEIVILEETALKSGIFEGALPTALSMGEAIPGVLSLYEGEGVDIVYVDQARANGSRNVEVKVEQKCAAGTIDLASGQ